MKKYFSAAVFALMLAIIIPQVSFAQKRGYYGQRPSIYQRHRNLINIGAGAGAGALIGAIIGGKKGAVVGSLLGGGGAAIYTYKVRPRPRTY